MDRSWIKEGKKFTGPYLKGCKEFIKFVLEHSKEGARALGAIILYVMITKMCCST